MVAQNVGTLMHQTLEKLFSVGANEDTEQYERCLNYMTGRCVAAIANRDREHVEMLLEPMERFAELAKEGTVIGSEIRIFARVLKRALEIIVLNEAED